MQPGESYAGSGRGATVCCAALARRTRQGCPLATGPPADHARPRSEVGLVFHAVFPQSILDGVGEMLGSGQPGVVSYFEEGPDLVHGTAMAVILPLPDSCAGHRVPGARPGRR